MPRQAPLHSLQMIGCSDAGAKADEPECPSQATHTVLLVAPPSDWLEACAQALREHDFHVITRSDYAQGMAYFMRRHQVQTSHALRDTQVVLGIRPRAMPVKNFAPEGSNTPHFHNVLFDSIYNDAMKENLDSIRFTQYLHLDAEMLKQVPVIPLFYGRILRITQNNISGIVTTPMNNLSLKYVEKK